MDSRFADSLGFFFCTIRFDSESIFAGAYVMLSTYSAVHTISWSKEKASSFLPSRAVGTGGRGGADELTLSQPGGIIIDYTHYINPPVHL